MSFWKARARPDTARSAPPEAAGREHLRSIGEYQMLYDYLYDRFANRVVLTFGEIEDLLGFPLPDLARAGQDWWCPTDGAARRSAQSDSWTLACRTAVVNMAARSVVFERQTALEPRAS
jgi:hypothetical protein